MHIKINPFSSYLSMLESSLSLLVNSISQHQFSWYIWKLLQFFKCENIPLIILY